MNVNSALWRVRVFNVSLAGITQRASGVTRYVHPSTLPSIDTLARVHENRFDALLREAFHSAAGARDPGR